MTAKPPLEKSRSGLLLGPFEVRRVERAATNGKTHYIGKVWSAAINGKPQIDDETKAMF